MFWDKIRLTCNRVIWVDLGLPGSVLLILRGRFLFCGRDWRLRDLVLQCGVVSYDTKYEAFQMLSLPSLYTWPSRPSVPLSALHRTVLAPSPRPWLPAVADAPRCLFHQNLSFCPKPSRIEDRPRIIVRLLKCICYWFIYKTQSINHHQHPCCHH